MVEVLANRALQGRHALEGAAAQPRPRDLGELPFGHVRLERQDGTRPVEGLDSALFVDREDDGFRGWMQIQADNVAEFLDESRVLRVLEVLDAVRLQPMLMPDPADHRFADAGG